MGPKFLVKATVYWWLVWALTKILTTFGGVYFPEVMNAWYDANAELVRSIPYYGEHTRALMRDNIADGDVVFWEVWFTLWILPWAYRMTRVR